MLGALLGLLEGAFKAGQLVLHVPIAMRFDILYVAPATYALGAAAYAAVALAGCRLLSKACSWYPRRSKWLATLEMNAPIALALGPIAYYLFRALFRLAFKTPYYAEAILIFGLAFQTTRILMTRRRLLERMPRQLPRMLALVLAIAFFVRGGRALAGWRARSVLPPVRQDTPNVLFITLDTLRADHLSAYGYARPTPSLDRVAREGAFFEYAVAPSSWTLPSHASLLTGLHVSQHRAESNTGNQLDRRFPTLAELFSRNGYVSGAFVANRWFCAGSKGFSRGFLHFEDLFFSFHESLTETEFGLTVAKRFSGSTARESVRRLKRAEEINSEFLGWLEERGAHPFFAWLNYIDPHTPYYAPPPFDRKYGHKPATGIPAPAFFGKTKPAWAGAKDLPDAQPLIDGYDCAIAYLDNAIGQLYNALQAKGLLDNTVLVVTADHGEGFGEHGLYGHQNSLYRELIQVPLFIRFPPRIRPQTRYDGPYDICDLPAAILSLAGVPNDGVIPGAPFDTVNGGIAVSELLHNPYWNAWSQCWRGDAVSIVTREWHAIFTIDGVELFEPSDTREQTDLAGTERGKAVIEALKVRLEKALPGRQIPGPPHR